MEAEAVIVTLSEIEPYKPPVLARYKSNQTVDLWTGRYWYEVDLDRCRNRAELADWCHHLADKVWFTMEHLKQFLEQAKFLPWQQKQNTNRRHIRQTASRA